MTCAPRWARHLVLPFTLLLLAARPAPAQEVAVRGETSAPASRAAARADSIARQEQLSYRREIFGYVAEGRRDPFVSLATTGVLRPTIADLRLVGVAVAARAAGSGVQSVAIFRDIQTKEQYRVHVGQPLGRMRVARIEPRRVVFSIDEFGVSRQESIAMGDSTRTITPTRAP